MAHSEIEEDSGGNSRERSAPACAVVVERHSLVLGIESPGAAVPWLGPALLGVLKRTWKARVCVQPERERWTRYQNCGGCEHAERCSYGAAFESEESDREKAFRGQEGRFRPVVAAPCFPVPERLEPGDEVEVRLTRIHEPLLPDATFFAECLAEAGAERGLGRDAIRFRVRAGSAATEVARITERDLPDGSGAGSIPLPRVRLVLESPLFIAEPIEASTLPRAALMTIGRLFRSYATPLDRHCDLARLRRSADAIQALEPRLLRFEQPHFRSRGRQHVRMRGWIGAVDLAGVPLAWLPWLQWAGRLHVGRWRAMGAGAFRVELG